MLLSRPEIVNPTSQVQRVEPRKWVQWDGRTEERGAEVVGDDKRGEADATEVEADEGDEEEDEDADSAADIG